jgi:hypothetical protein
MVRVIALTLLDATPDVPCLARRNAEGRVDDKLDISGGIMEIKKCQFDQLVEKRYSTGLYKGMFNEDVTFQLEVEVKGTDRKDTEDMLKLFQRATTDFKRRGRRSSTSCDRRLRVRLLARIVDILRP